MGVFLVIAYFAALGFIYECRLLGETILYILDALP